MKIRLFQNKSSSLRTYYWLPSPCRVKDKVLTRCGKPGDAPFRSTLKEEFTVLWQGVWLADSLQCGWLLQSGLGYLAKTMLFEGWLPTNCVSEEMVQGYSHFCPRQASSNGRSLLWSSPESLQFT